VPEFRIAHPADLLPFLKRMLFEAANWRPDQPRPSMDEGLAIMQALLREAERRGMQRISLSVEEDNPSRKLYVSEGFEVVGRVANSDTMVWRA